MIIIDKLEAIYSFIAESKTKYTEIEKSFHNLCATLNKKDMSFI